MTDRPDDRRPDDPSRPDDGQWRPVDPPTEAAGPYQPNPYPQQNPPTRAFDPYAQQPYGQPDPYAQQPYGQPDPYATQGPVYGGPAYGPTQQLSGGPGTPPPGYGQGYGEYAPAGGPPPPNGGSSRTLWLIAAVVALILVVALVAGYFLISRSDSSDDTAAAASSTSEPAPSTDNLFPTFADPSTPQDGGQPSASAAPGQVLYQLSGNGQVLGVTFASGTTLKVSPTLITPPWSVAATVDSDPSLTAVVLSGSVTCTISRDGQVLTTATSSTGLLRCAVPAG
ncbi:MAG: hypothetical protein INR72_14930 [Williamsia herbipolensis]|nr:hypothetical protein [Williamsia herbipolensis]